MGDRSPKPTSAREAATRVADRLREAGCVALFAGGCVRDLLLGRSPADYDVATDAVPAKVRSLFRRTIEVGAQFGVVIVVLGEFQIEVATFRSEAGYADGRHPTEVRFSDARQDAARRDFTINGMFLDPRTGEVIDYVGGRADLSAGVIRAIGQADERFAEDHLRMLRAVRFAANLDFALEPATEAAIARHARLITDVSAERVWQEWGEKLLGGPGRSAGWRLAEKLGLRAVLWPELSPHAAAIEARLARLSADADAVVALACQFMDRSVAQVHEACRALALDNRRRLAVAWLVEHARDLVAGPLDIVALKKRLADENWSRLVGLSAAALDPADGAGRANLDANRAAAGAIAPGDIAPPPLIDGQDVMSLGQPEGPAIGRVLAAVYDEQLADRVRTRDEAMAVARRLLQDSRGRG